MNASPSMPNGPDQLVQTLIETLRQEEAELQSEAGVCSVCGMVPTIDPCEHCDAQKQAMLNGRHILGLLHEAGIINGMVDRVVLDISADNPVKIYEQRYADEHFLNVFMGKPVIMAVQAASVLAVDCESEESDG